MRKLDEEAQYLSANNLHRRTQASSSCREDVSLGVKRDIGGEVSVCHAAMNTMSLSKLDHFLKLVDFQSKLLSSHAMKIAVHI